MASKEKIAANQRNARRSTGPRTARGKSRASRNALKHGLTMITLANPTFSSEIEEIAKAICGEDTSPQRYEQALTIAECEMAMQHVRAACTGVAIVDNAARRRKHQLPGFPRGGNERAMDALARGHPQRATKTIYGAGNAARALAVLAAADIEVGKDPDLGPAQEADPAPQHDQIVDPALEAMPAGEPRYEPETLQRALSELRKLERYECRALSRRRRAIREFDTSLIGSLRQRAAK